MAAPGPRRARGSPPFCASQRSTASECSAAEPAQSSSEHAIIETTGTPTSQDCARSRRASSTARPILVVLREAAAAPVRLPDDDVPARSYGGRERLDRIGEASVDEARAQAQRGVVRLRLVRRVAASPSSNVTRSPSPASAACSTATAWSPVTSRAVPRAAELGGEQTAGPPRPDAMSRTRESGPSPRRFPRRSSFSSDVGFWISARLRDDEVAGNHGIII